MTRPARPMWIPGVGRELQCRHGNELLLHFTVRASKLKHSHTEEEEEEDEEEEDEEAMSREHDRNEEDEVEERIRQRKLEEALEIQSLRRIVSAYLNYPDAADADVRRYERHYQKLPPAHKALISHYPLKFQSLRRCISANARFIFCMLEEFEPPLDMSQDLDTSEDHKHGDFPNGVSDCCTSNSTCTSGRSCHTSPNQVFSADESNGVENEGRTAHTDACSGNDGMDCCGNVASPSHEWLEPCSQLHVPLVDVDKVRCIIRNLVRDWGAEGQKERDQCYNPILTELDALFPNRNVESPPTCLLPGAGLGRLALEISRLGFVSQGNEFSYYTMICSSFILNYTQAAGEWKIYPWIHSNCNSRSDTDQLRAVSIPDIHPASAGLTPGFSMCGGDFVEVYSDPSHIGSWDAIVTCFFIDTAHNIIEYIEIISKILKDGGVWINMGPLLYHFAEMYGKEDEMSIELSLEDVKNVALKYGFHFEKESTIETTYTTNPRSMMQNRYFAEFWTARKISAVIKEEVSD